MKRITFLILLLLISIICYPQAIQYEGDYVKIKKEDWEKFKINAISSYYDNQTKDSIIILLKQKIRRDSIISIKQDSITFLLRNELADCDSKLNSIVHIAAETKPETQTKWIEWVGCYTGLKTYYELNSESNSTKFIEGLKYGIYLNMNLRIKDILITPDITVPLQKGSTNINLKIGYRIF
jgi:hypothetical protein